MKKFQEIQDNKIFQYSSLYDLLYNKSVENSDKDFTISISNNNIETLKYCDFFKKTNKVREFFIQSGLKKHSIINLILPNSADLLIIQYAALSLSIIVVPINYNLTTKEIEYIVNDSNPEIIIFDIEFIKKIESIKLDSEIRLIALSKFTHINSYFNIYDLYSDVSNEVFEHKEDFASLDDKALIIYTSGTSGNPKGCILTHMNLLSDGKAIAEWFNFDSNTRTLCLLPLFHNNGQVPTFLAPLWAGGSTIFSRDSINFVCFWELVSEYSVTWSSVIPTILSILLSLNNQRKDNTMKGIICGGALLPSKVQIEFEKRFGVPIFEGYGLTETTSFSTFNPLSTEKRIIGSVGQTLPINIVEIFNEEGHKLPDGEIGEICIKGYNVFTGYNKLPQQNKKAFQDDWFHSGDYGYKDKNGFFYIKGRHDDLIIRGGENIYPREIENVVYMFPGVKDCAVVGIVHKIMGEEPVLFIETIDNKTIEKLDIINFIAKYLAKYKIPSKIIFMHDLKDMKHIPKGPTNKILRKNLKKYYEENLLNKSK